MVEEFLNFLDKLMLASPDIVEKNMTDNIRTYIEFLYNSQKKKSLLTENGKNILTFLQSNQEKNLWSSKDIAYILKLPSRGIAAGLRKLVEDGYVEKIGMNPVNYILTEKGKNYNQKEE